jgi:N-acetylglucosamine-6-sulfatase
MLQTFHLLGVSEATVSFGDGKLTSLGGYPKFISQGLNENYLPVWMQAAGYNTYYTGKLFNDHNITNYDTPYPAGFTQNNFLLDPLTYSFYDSFYQKDKEAPRQLNGSYSTDVLADSTIGFMDHSISEEKPFFIVAAPVAPHSAHTGDFENGSTAPLPAKRHEGLFENEIVPRNPGFNPDEVRLQAVSCF